MVSKDAAAWDEIRQLYADDAQTIVEIGALFGVTPRDIAERRKLEGWPMRAARLAETRRVANAAAGIGQQATGCGGPGAQSDTPAPARTVRKTPSRDALRRRLLRLAERNLALMEEHMDATSGKTSAQERERTTRTVGALIKTIEKVTELGPDQRASKAADPCDADATASLRRELAERLYKLWGGTQP